ncbi:DUF4267 domain-containing protein [Frankia sp. AiPs1]|uniref:DUF4267 domain-containing protein n=1 Tax=Frankia sp. AiPs1 TaxID=573493 RepID=UPI0020441851|nr:DUF4267 domain-containing protein [Frankia sp. AiPs1]MCM3924098.1 DUF4267 domain-containing protein [Frankia sp. AiPs1]
MTTVAYVLSWIVSVTIIFIGMRFLLVPRAAAAAFGVAVPPDIGQADAFFAVKGIRDIASGLVPIALILASTHQAVGWFMLMITVVPLGDALIVLRNRGPKVTAYAIHGLTAVLLFIIAGLLLA